MTAYSKITDDPLYVVCGDHNIRYPAVCKSCPQCPEQEGRMRNRSHDKPTVVTIANHD